MINALAIHGQLIMMAALWRLDWLVHFTRPATMYSFVSVIMAIQGGPQKTAHYVLVAIFFSTQAKQL